MCRAKCEGHAKPDHAIVGSHRPLPPNDEDKALTAGDQREMVEVVKCIASRLFRRAGQARRDDDPIT
jgi:hypothetical protein